MSPVGWSDASDASDVLSLRWDDGSYVVDPDNRIRGNRGGRDHERSSTDSLTSELSERHHALTLEEWRRQSGYDPATKTYAGQ